MFCRLVHVVLSSIGQELNKLNWGGEFCQFFFHFQLKSRVEWLENGGVLSEWERTAWMEKGGRLWQQSRAEAAGPSSVLMDFQQETAEETQEAIAMVGHLILFIFVGIRIYFSSDTFL